MATLFLVVIALVLAPMSCRDSPPAAGRPGPLASAVVVTPAATSLQPGRVRLSASVLTIAHVDVDEHHGPRPTRTRAEALELARAVAAEARRDPSRFPDIAREHSDDPLGPEGGAQGTWSEGERPDIDAAVAALAVGAVSDPVPSEHGFLVLRRDSPVLEERIAARRVIVAWAGAARAPASLVRSKAEALARAEALAAQARNDPGGFEALIRAESDGWDRDRGGRMGTWTANGGRFPVAVERAVQGLADGGISDPVASRFGYEVLQRMPASGASLLAGAHVLITFAGAERAGPGVRRTREEALAEAQQLADEARRDPSRFGQLAATRSDDATGKRGGDLGSFRKGTLPAAVEEALERLAIREVGGPVLTRYGYHVLLRREAPTDKEYVAP